VAVEVNGRWRRAVQVPGLAALNKGGNAEVSSVSCAPPGNCTASGDYRDGGGRQQAFVVSEKNGVWGTAIDGPGLRHASRDAYLSSVSCASAGSCVAVGSYQVTGRFAFQGFVT
jgi:hypothetical protein